MYKYLLMILISLHLCTPTIAEDIIDQNRITLLIVTTKNCIFCEELKSDIKDIKQDFLIKIINNDHRLVKKYNITIYPTTIAVVGKIDKSVEKSRIVGYSKIKFLEWIEEIRSGR